MPEHAGSVEPACEMLVHNAVRLLSLPVFGEVIVWLIASTNQPVSSFRSPKHITDLSYRSSFAACRFWLAELQRSRKIDEVFCSTRSTMPSGAFLTRSRVFNSQTLAFAKKLWNASLRSAESQLKQSKALYPRPTMLSSTLLQLCCDISSTLVKSH